MDTQGEVIQNTEKKLWRLWTWLFAFLAAAFRKFSICVGWGSGSKQATDYKDQVTHKFENKLWWIWFSAVWAGALHKLSIWVGGGAITWATVVLMGGFASALSISDFTIVTVLVLLISILLALAHSTCKLVTKKSLSTGSQQPVKLVYKDMRLVWVTGIKFSSVFIQWVLLACILWLSIPTFRRSKPDLGCLFSFFVSGKFRDDSAAGLAHLEACFGSSRANDNHTAAEYFPAQNSTDTATSNLQICLFTFHSLVIFTCILVFFCNLSILWPIGRALSLMCSGRPKTSMSLTRYHDEVLSRSLNLGLVDADEFDEMEFLMQGVGVDLVGRKIAPLEVRRQNEDFIKYSLYHVKGVEMVMEMLASEDTLRQQTAANMPGFWSSESEYMEKVGMILLSKLGEKLGFPGKVAEGAANSFKSLAVAWRNKNPSPLLKVYVSRSEGQRQNFGASESSHTPVLRSGEFTSSSLPPIISTIGGGAATDAVSRSEGGMEGGGGSLNAISRSGGGRDGAGSGSGSGGAEWSNMPSSTGVEKKESMQRSFKSGAAEGEGSGVSESSQTVVSPEGEEGHGHSQAGGGAGCKSSNVVSVSDGELIPTAPKSGLGQRGTSAGQSVSTSGGGSRGRGVRNDELEWNVVQKVMDLVVNKRLATVQVYVRALDAFFMSESIIESLTEEEMDRIKRKLLTIAQGGAIQGSGAAADRVNIRVDSSTRARTKLLAFSALELLGLDAKYKEGNQLLQQVYDHLKQVEENSVIWIEEEERYKEICNKYAFKPADLQSLKQWKIQGADFLKPR